MVRRTDPHRWLEGGSSHEEAEAVHQPQRAGRAGAGEGAGSRDPVIAELQRAKEAAESANEAKSRYLMTISHEIRSPLNAIYGYAQLLERGAPVPAAEAGAAIRRSVDHLTALAESLLEISQVESGVLKIRSDVTDIRALLRQVVSIFQAQAITKGLQLKLNVADSLPALVKTDQKRLRQVLINLVSNAIKYTEAGSVDVAVHYRSQVATIQVIDTGIGIEPDEMARVFEPFERGSSKSVKSQPGIGLGLAITRVLCQVMGGDMTATSTPGEGSCFQLKLMLPTPSTLPEDKPADFRIDGYRGSPRTVLLVDDDPDQGAALRSLLQSAGFIVFVAGSGIEGIDLAVRSVPDLVLLDLQMPEISGWETARRLRAAHGTALKIVIMSASIPDADVDVDAGGQGERLCDAFIPKPVGVDALFATMQQQLGLEWDYIRPEQGDDREAIVSRIPAEARPLLERLRQFARMGHVLGVEEQLAELEQAFPTAAPFTATLRRHRENFDFDAIVETIENA